jgi:hypothetical protein
VALAGEGRDRLVAFLQALDQILGAGSEEIDRAAVDLRSHRPGEIVVDALKAEHDERRVVELVPEFLFQPLLIVSHFQSSDAWLGNGLGAGAVPNPGPTAV